MTRIPQDITPPKAHYRAERDNGHSDWLTAFHREYLQNLLDAGATSARITIDEAPSRSTFGRSPNLSGSENSVVRVEIADNGSGMTEDVLRNVFFRPGESTKNGPDAIGGFGTARLMLCYAQDSYRIVTNGHYVEGDGSQYLVSDIDTAREEIRASIAASDGESRILHERELQSLGALVRAQENGGCVFSIDLPMGRHGNIVVTKDSVEDALHRYLSMSQISCNVSLNGEELKGGALRRQARRQLTASVDGVETPFATVHVSNSAAAPWRGKLLVRSSGALMYSRDIDSQAQVIVELTPSMSRQVLTDRRDNLKLNFRSSLDAFVGELNSDATNALRGRDSRKDTTVKGGKGAFTVEGDREPDFSFTGSVVLDETALDPAEIPDSIRVQLAREIEANRPTFLDRYPQKAEVEAFKRAILLGDGWSALSDAPTGLQVFVTQGLAQSMRAAGVSLSQAGVVRNRFGEMHDVRIVTDDFSPEEDRIKNSARRWSPDYWVMLGDERNAPLGRGLQAHKFLAAWTVCVHEAFRAVKKARPDLAEELDGERYTTGFRFARGREQYSSSSVHIVREASMVLSERDGNAAALLINPLNVDGSTAYDLTRENALDRPRADRRPVLGMAELEAQAVSDVCRLVNRLYDRDFADLFVGAMSLFDRVRSREEISRAETAVLSAYGKGEAMVQKMDTAPGNNDGEIRPAERLLAIAAPHVMAAVGLSAANPQEPSAAIEVLSSKFIKETDGLTTVDCNLMQTMENRLVMTSENGWKNDGADIPARKYAGRYSSGILNTVMGDGVQKGVELPADDVLDLSDDDLAALELPEEPMSSPEAAADELDGLDLSEIDLAEFDIEESYDDNIGVPPTPDEEEKMRQDVKRTAREVEPVPEEEVVQNDAANPWLADEFDVSAFMGGP